MLSWLFHKEDIRKYGSGNPGFTNYKRVYGNSFSTWCVLLIDIVKTVIPVLATALILKANCDLWQTGAAFSGLFCMIGHCFPVWYKFKGGKGFLAGFATIWFVDWRMALIATFVFLVVLLAGKYMSLASCSASLTCPIALAILGPSNIYVLILCIVSALLVILRHHENIRKLINGTESKFVLFEKKSDSSKDSGV